MIRRIRFPVVLIQFACIVAIRPAHASAADQPIRVTVWDEQQPSQKQAYENFLGNAIADYLKTRFGLSVTSTSINAPDKGLGRDLVENTQVLIWWGHVRQGEISIQRSQEIVERIKKGKLSLIALHSAHWSNPFIEAMNERTRLDTAKRYPSIPGGLKYEFEFIPSAGRLVPTADSLVTPAYYALRAGNVVKVRVDMPNCCFPAYRADGKPSHVTVLLPDHPLARGLPRNFDIPHDEMYNEPFHVPEPDEVVFEERWDTGEHFRGGCVWRIGAGRVFYFRPGHETFAVYKQPETLRIIENAVRWMGEELPASNNLTK